MPDQRTLMIENTQLKLQILELQSKLLNEEYNRLKKVLEDLQAQPPMEP